MKTLFRAALDLLLPPRCLATGEIVDAQGMVSAAAWRELQFIAPPHCACCGAPFPFEVPGENVLCVSCLEYPPAFDRARAAVVYNEMSRKMILAFKYGDKPHAVKTFVPWMLRAGPDVLAEADLVAPVPLHRKRLWQRRYNQSALLAREIAHQSGKNYIPDLLARIRATPPQQGLSRKERNLNVRGAFAAIKPERAAGKTVLLVDDVYTSGATLNECARVLKAAGAKAVDILAIARVTKEEF